MATLVASEKPAGEVKAETPDIAGTGATFIDKLFEYRDNIKGGAADAIPCALDLVGNACQIAPHPGTFNEVYLSQLLEAEEVTGAQAENGDLDGVCDAGMKFFVAISAAGDWRKHMGLFFEHVCDAANAAAAKSAFTAAVGSPPSEAQVVTEGGRVVCKYPPFKGRADDPWFSANITAVDSDAGTINVVFADGDVAEGLPIAQVYSAPDAPDYVGKGSHRFNDLKDMLASFNQGPSKAFATKPAADQAMKVEDRVVCKFPPYKGKDDDPWFSANITAVNAGAGTVDVVFTDGDAIQGMPIAEVYSAPDAPDDVGKGSHRFNDFNKMLASYDQSATASFAIKPASIRG